MYMIFSNLGNYTVKVSRYILNVGGDICGWPSGCADKDPWQQEKTFNLLRSPRLDLMGRLWWGRLLRIQKACSHCSCM